jgi:hypothetical protein
MFEKQAAIYDHVDILQQADVRQRVAAHGDKVAEAAFRQSADVLNEVLSKLRDGNTAARSFAMP